MGDMGDFWFSPFSRRSRDHRPVANGGIPPEARPAGDDRGRSADERDRRADERDRRADERDRRADEREAGVDGRELVALERDATADERDRLADDRDRVAAVRDDAADERDRQADERDRLADQRDALAEDRADQRARLRADLADIAERMAETTDHFAAFLERRAPHGDAAETARRAAREREGARVHRRNAQRLRKAGSDLPHPVLERAPSMDDDAEGHAAVSPEEPSGQP
jgi:hypothetical protein